MPVSDIFYLSKHSFVVEYNVNEKQILMWAKRFKNLATWNAIAHVQPLANTLQKGIIKHSHADVSVDFQPATAQVF
jgi:hypothetical protein